MALHRFDALVRALTIEYSRRAALTLLGSLLAAPLTDLASTDARKKKKAARLHAELLRAHLRQ